MKLVGLAVIASSLATVAFAYEDQWQPSSKTLSAYVAEGYALSQPVVLHLSPFDRVQYRYYLIKGQAIAQCTEDVTTRKAIVVDKVLACADLATPFQK
ncbi:hypothetical protein WH91_17710 [Devosia psychrophila]|uniref:UrcA family protein n=1 Tax=Devosia psychrophila TaxID=728005 RepID=A0ABR5DV21_9HYPH|nr:hypothetical protein [Devosia psychrophila]KKC31840.1 hypothetical protein WH91_17710 [Devosia psychrophila]